MLARQCNYEFESSSLPLSKYKDDDRGVEGFLNGLPETTERVVAAREYIFCEGDAKTHLYEVKTGAVCISKISIDGSRQVIKFALSGDVIGLGSQENYDTYAQATTLTKLKALSYASLRRIIQEDTTFSMKLWEMMTEELTATRNLVVTVGQRSAPQRIATFLLNMQERNRRQNLDSNTIVLLMTRSDIADYLGLTIETVSRTLTKFKLQKIIDIVENRHVTILNFDKLEDLAEGDI